MKKLAKILSVILALALVLGLAACGGKTENDAEGNTEAPAVEGVDYSKVKIGFIFLHDPNASTYDANFYQAAKAVVANLGLSEDQVIYKWNIPEEGSDCYDTAAEMIDEGCNIIFADSFGHESNMLLAAADYPEVQFCHATGTHAIVSDLANYHNAFASIYDGRFLAGVAAGMKLNQMIEEGKITADQAKIGYVGAWPYAEVISGYTSFYLGARYICESATMDVVYTNSWFDIALEREGALKLIDDGCVLISQHADSEGAPKACEERGVPNVAYNKDTSDLGPTTAIVSSKINWEPYFTLIINSVAKGEAIPDDYCGSLATGSVQLTAVNEKVAAPGTAEKIEEVKALLEKGELKVFDTATFTVKGEKLESYTADVQDMGDYQPETEVIKDGAFVESGVDFGFRSAPYFDVIIDGITLK
ncbi:MAG: BMP family ABC transporter substrate-binding protein [Clostridia bacterium]|nr:BMP family ABC transporter substrate-binding protein [Clostridia bacterium]